MTRVNLVDLWTAVSVTTRRQSSKAGARSAPLYLHADGEHLRLEARYGACFGVIRARCGCTEGTFAGSVPGRCFRRMIEGLTGEAEITQAGDRLRFTLGARSFEIPFTPETPLNPPVEPGRSFEVSHLRAALAQIRHAFGPYGQGWAVHLVAEGDELVLRAANTFEAIETRIPAPEGAFPTLHLDPGAADLILDTGVHDQAPLWEVAPNLWCYGSMTGPHVIFRPLPERVVRPLGDALAPISGPRATLVPYRPLEDALRFLQRAQRTELAPFTVDLSIGPGELRLRFEGITETTQETIPARTEGSTTIRLNGTHLMTAVGRLQDVLTLTADSSRLVIENGSAKAALPCTKKSTQGP